MEQIIVCEVDKNIEVDHVTRVQKQAWDKCGLVY